MIRINLLFDVTAQGGKKNKFFSTSNTQAMGTSLSNAFAGGDENTQLGIRVGVLLLPLILLIGYRWAVNTATENNFKRLQKEQQAIQAQLRTLDPIVKELEKYQEEKNKLTSQLQAIKVLSKERLKNVKSLDVIQTIIPMKAWLTSLKVLDKNVDLDGLATDDLVVADFMSNLQSSIYFSNIRLIATEEYKRADGVVKKFKIKCNLENL